ncbi:MAG: MFS transporter [Gemmataceae bacterium]
MAGIVNASGGPDQKWSGANKALMLLLLINLFNYIDRQVLSAVLPRLELDGTLFAPNDPEVKFKLGLLTSAFLVAYMLFSPLVGWLDGHGFRRWWILGAGVTAWSLASGGSGFASAYWLLFLTRCCVGIGEGAYGPIASTMLADIFPIRSRGAVMAIFNMAIPVGSALGFVIGGTIADAMNDWRPAFWITFVGLILGFVCFVQKEPPRPKPASAVVPAYSAVLKDLLRNRSFVLCCLGMTAVTFVLGGVAAWVPSYVFQREGKFEITQAVLNDLEHPEKGTLRRIVPPEVIAKLQPLADGTIHTMLDMKKLISERLDANESAIYQETIVVTATKPGSPTLGSIGMIFGGIVVVAGFTATAFGAWLGERLRTRVKGAYFLVIGFGALFSLPSYLLFLYTPFPLGWLFVFLAVFGLFMHTGPAFTLLANVVTSEERATAFALNILIIHALGDVISPPFIGAVADRSSLHFAFLITSVMIVLGGVLWIWGARYLDEDTNRANVAS